MLSLKDYTIDHHDLDWPNLLASWAWLVPRQFTIWIMNRFGDLFLVLEDGSVHRLDVGAGSFEQIAMSRDDFARSADENGNSDDWFMIPLVDKLREAGITLQKGECYSYWQLLILSGDYTVENTKVTTIDHHYKALGPIHEAIRDIPDGTRITFKVDGL